MLTQGKINKSHCYVTIAYINGRKN